MRKLQRVQILRPFEVAYIRTALDSSDPRRVQKALQHLCKLDRQRYVASAKDRQSLETILLGVLIKGTSDEPVRRWALNALAAVGSFNGSMPGVLNAIRQFDAEPQVVSAAIAAAFRLSPKAHNLIEDLDLIDPRLVMLSALQTARPDLVPVTEIKIDIESDSEVLQKLSLVNIGLGKAPESLFHPRHSNATIVKILSRDGSPMVSQYAVWAIAENDDFNASDLGIESNKFDDHPINVQAYIHRLYASKGDGGALQHEIICRGLDSEHPKIRLETAIGMRDAFHNGLDVIVSDAVLRESDDDVRQHLIDHIVRQSNESSTYRNLSLEIYRTAEQDEKLRERMRAAAVGVDVTMDFREVDADSHSGFIPQLFGGSITVNNPTTFINNGPMQGVIAQQGDANNYGSVNSQVIARAEEALKILSQAEKDVEVAPLSPELRQEVLSAIQEAQKEPTRDRIGKVQSLLNKAKDILATSAEASESVVKLAGYASLLVACLS